MLRLSLFVLATLFYLSSATLSTLHGLHVLSHRQNTLDELRGKLSPGARILTPVDADFVTASTRWQEYAKPTFSAIVEVASELDISETILYANKHSLPFLALGGAHGAVRSLANFQQGIGIRLGKLKKIEFSADGTYATIEGGNTNGDVMRALKAANKQSATGVCECTGFVGALLGGGHGLLQGHFGMVADNLIDARVVLANGSIITLNATDKDFFWAMRGAGHNFGIVPSIRFKVWEPSFLNWNYTMMAFSQDKLEVVYEAMNKITARPQHELTNVVNYAVWMRSPDVDPVNAVIMFGILYPIPDSNGSTFTSMFLDLKPLSVQSSLVSYYDLPKLTGNGDDSPICQHGTSNHLRFPIYLNEYNITAIRSTYDLFNNMTAKVSAFKDSVILFEAYSLIAMTETDWSATAFPWRDTKVLVAPVITYSPDALLDDTATEFGNRTRQLLFQGQGDRWKFMRSYVNYAFGDEALDQVYCTDTNQWRLWVLTSVKQRVDPDNLFRWYMPIVQ